MLRQYILDLRQQGVYIVDMSPRNIAILITLEAGYSRDVMHGISRYIRTHTPRIVYGGPEQVFAAASDIAKWPGDGIIAHIATRAILEALRNIRIPVVNVSQGIANLGIPSVLPDNAVVGQLAAEHLLGRGFRHFAFCGLRGRRFSAVRGQAFAETAEQAGFACARFDGDQPSSRPRQDDPCLAELAQWVRNLPKPVGIMACNDVRAWHITRVCADMGLHIPEEVALVGADNDALMCEMSNPPLSSVDVSAEQVGYQAAALLARLMDGAAPPRAPLLVPPRGVVVRRSSDILAIPDPLVAQAVRFIHDHVHQVIDVEDVVGTVPLSRRALERRFRTLLDQTIYQTITAARLDRAKQLLILSDAPTSAVAEQVGFSYVQQFNTIFKRATSLTPRAYRRRFRGQ
jgi:LacI family transcriptional regulator